MRKQAIASLCKVSALVALMLTGMAHAKTWHVATNGKDTNPGTEAQPWASPGYAVKKESPVAAGDEIIVHEGVYSTAIICGKSGTSGNPITIRAQGPVTIHDPKPFDGGWFTATIRLENVKHWIVDGFRVEQANGTGILIAAGSHIIIRNCHTYETGYSGITTVTNVWEHTDIEQEIVNFDITIENCVVQRAQWVNKDNSARQEGFTIWATDGFVVKDCEMRDTRRNIGFDVKVSRNGKIYGNRFSHTWGSYGLYIDGAQDLDIQNNVSFDNGQYNYIIHNEGGDVPAKVSKRIPTKRILFANNVSWGAGKLESAVPAQKTGLKVDYAEDVQVYNNVALDGVIIGTTWKKDIVPRARGVKIRNNIFNGVTISKSDNIEVDHNVIGSSEITPKNSTGIVIGDNKFGIADFGFVNQSGNNYQLAAGSPAIDAGTATGAPKTDMAGNSRPIGGGFDAGAFEQGGTLMSAPAKPGQVAAEVIGGNEIKITWKDESNNEVSFQIERDEGSGKWDKVYIVPAGVTELVDRQVAGATKYTYRVRSNGLMLVSDYATTQITSSPNGNIALGKNAWAKSEQTVDKLAIYAVDGTVGSFWNTKNQPFPTWMAVDLGKSWPIKKVVVRWNKNFAREFTIQTSDDSTNWKDVKKVTGAKGGVDEIDVSGAGRYVRLYCTAPRDPASQWIYASVHELEIYQSTDVTSMPHPVPPNNSFSVAAQSQAIADLTIFNAQGRTIAEIESLEGRMTVDRAVSALSLPRGIYQARWMQSGRIVTRRIMRF